MFIVVHCGTSGLNFWSLKKGCVHERLQKFASAN